VKRIIITAFICAFLTAPVMADQVTMYYRNVDGHNPGDYRTGDGGEFVAQMADSWSFALGNYASTTHDQAGYDNSFQTFCLERNEYIYDGRTHDFDISLAAWKGGLGGPSPDPISKGTAYLYKQFATGQLTGYSYDPGPDRQNSAGLLQNAIWALEQELDAPSKGDNTFWDLVVDKFGVDSSGAPLAMDDASAGYGVRVMNLHDCVEPVFQSQLVLVPVPAAALLGFLGFGYAGMKLRKMT
jgi:hypothetical protein